MGLISPLIKYPLIFVAGGLIFTFLAPMLAALAALLLIMFLILLVLFFIIPSGWIFSLISSSIFLLSSIRIFRKLLVAGFLATLSAFILTILVKSPSAFFALSFAIGGALALFLFFPSQPSLRPARPEPVIQPARRESIVVEVGKSGSLSHEGLTSHEFESGVLVVGARARTVTRRIVKSLAEWGYKVIIIGSGRLIPEGVEAEYYRAYAVDVSKDFEKYEESPDNMVYALALANRLKNDDVSNLLPAARVVRQGVLQGTVGRSEILHSIQVQDRRLAPLLASIAASTRCVAPGGLHIQQILSSDARVVCVEPAGTSRDVAFIIGYLVLMLVDKGAVLVIEDPEVIIKDINLLSYESREPWERLYLALDYAKQSGLILVSRASPKTERVWSLCNTYILTELADMPHRVSDRARALIPLIRSLKPMEGIISGEGDRKFKIEKVYPASIEPKVIGRALVVAAPQAPQAQVEVEAGEEQAGEAFEPVPQLTTLERLFGEKAIDVARILEQARGGLARPSEGDSALVKELEEKGYLTSLGEVYYTTAMGEEILSEHQRIVKERGPLAAVAQDRVAAAPAPAAAPAQTVIDVEASSRLDEALASFYMAESLFRQGKYGPCVMVAYEFMTGAIKKFFDIEKGHLDDLVKELVNRGIDVGLTQSEAKDAKTVMIEVSNALKEGRQVPITSAQRMLKYARKVLEALQRAGGAGSEGG